MFDAVDDAAVVIAEDNVAVFSHQLHHKRLLTKISHLIQMLDVKADDALHLWLMDAHDAPAADVLAQQHAKARSLHGARLVFVSEIYKRKRGAGADAQPPLSCGSLDCQEKLICLRLSDLADPPAFQSLL